LACFALQSFRHYWSAKRCRHRLVILSWNSLPVQSVAPVDVSAYWFADPTVPLGQFPRLCGFPVNRVGRLVRNQPAQSSRRVHVPPESVPSNPSRLSQQDRRLSWASAPLSTWGLEGPLFAGLACPLCSAFRVWLPSWRFAPFEPCQPCFRSAALMGLPLRSFLLPKGIRGFHHEWTRLPFLLHVTAHCWTAECSSRLPGFDPFESPLRSIRD